MEDGINREYQTTISIMGKVIRKTYPLELSIGVLLLILGMSFFLSAQIFTVTFRQILDGTPALFGMFLVSVAVLVMVLILWEEFLFPIKIRPTDAGVEFKNHRNKLRTQLVIFLAIPAIYVFVYLQYEVSAIRFFICALINIAAPVIGRLSSGLKNYNDFLKLTNDAIIFKNNEKTAKLPLKMIQYIKLVKDERGVLHKLLVGMEGREVVIDIDEMELEAYYSAIDRFVTLHYPELVRSDQ